MSPLREAAIQAHEMYVELKNAGFSRGEAIELIAKAMASGISEAARQANEDD
jgi:uncharacterized protein YoaH (UPF0181 family)